MIRIFTSKTQQVGQIGEDLAAVFLMKQGFVIHERNVQTRNGEIDIVTHRDGVWHFFEVKAGKQGSVFNPAQNLTPAKLRKFHRAVEYYCFGHGISEYRVQGILVYLSSNPAAEHTIEIIDLS
jgi:putative endonuclease